MKNFIKTTFKFLIIAALLSIIPTLVYWLLTLFFPIHFGWKEYFLMFGSILWTAVISWLIFKVDEILTSTDK